MTLGLLSVSLALPSYVAFIHLTQDKSDSIKLQTNDAAKFIAERIGSEIDDKIGDLRRLDNLLSAGKNAAELIATDPDILVISKYVLTAANPRRVYTQYLMPPDKKAQFNPDFLANDEKSLLPRLKTVFQGQALLLTRAKGLNHPVWFLAYPIEEGDTVIAVITAYLSTDLFEQALDTENYTIYFLDSDHRVLLHSDNKDTIADNGFHNHPMAQLLLEQDAESGASSYHNSADRKEYFGGFAKLDFGKTAAIVEIEKGKAFASLHRLRIIAATIAIAVAILALYLVNLFSKTISEPVRKLKYAADAIRTGNYHVRLVPTARDEIGDLTQAFNEMAIGLDEREKLKGALSKFVNPDIAERAAKGEIRLGGERKHATIFFSDIRSFTTISEKLAPEAVVEFLNEYMTIMVKIINAHGGIVDKFIGDAIMAVWGLPEARPDDAVNAVSAALAMRQALLEFNKDRGSDERPVIKIGCGLNSGFVLAGQIGSDDRLDYTVIGDAVNLASRIEALNKPFLTDILISEDTYELVKERFDCVPMQRIKVKGKTQPVKIYAVLRAKNDSTGPAGIRALRELLGLETETQWEREMIKK